MVRFAEYYAQCLNACLTARPRFPSLFRLVSGRCLIHPRAGCAKCLLAPQYKAANQRKDGAMALGMTESAAETLALSGLAWLAGEPDEIGRFLRNSGLEVADLKTRAEDRGVMVA